MARPDVIHYHGRAVRAVAFCALVRYSYSGHDSWSRLAARQMGCKFASTYLKLGESTAATCADEVDCAGAANVQRYFKDTYGRDVRFIPNGIERNESVPANEITRKYGLVKDGYVLFLGRIVPEKACIILSRHSSNWILIRSWSSPADLPIPLNTMNRFNLLRLPIRIVLTGFIEGQELAGVVQQCLYLCVA